MRTDADFEDCLQDECAQDIKADYKESWVKAVTPEQFLKENHPGIVQ